MLKQKKNPKKRKRSRQNPQEQQDPWSEILAVCVQSNSMPEKRRSCPQKSQPASHYCNTPRAREDGGAAPRNKTKENRTKPPRIIWDNKVSPRHLDTLMHRIP